MADIDEIDIENLSDASEPFIDEDWDLEPEDLPNPPRENIPPSDAKSEAQYQAIRKVCECLSNQKLDLDVFLHGLCYGNDKAVADTLTKKCRRQLMTSALLPEILDNLHTPPRYSGARPKAASATLDCWAWKHVIRQARGELHEFAQEAKQNDTGTYGDLDLEDLGIDKLTAKVKTYTPQLSRFLTLVGETKARVRSRKDQSDFDDNVEPSFAAVMNVHSIAFLYAPRCNKVPKMLCLYFRAKHVPKSLFTLFNKCGYVMSYTWSLDAIRKLSKEALARMLEAVNQGAVFWIYDNLRLPTPIKSQRGDRHTVTDNGTAMTVVEMPESVKHIFIKFHPPDTTEPPQLATAIESMHVDQTSTIPKPLIWDDFMDEARLERLIEHDIHSLTYILFDTVPGLEDCELRSSAELQLSTPQIIMPAGPDHRTHYHMLGTVPIDETSIGGNIQVIYEMLKQQGLDSEENQKILGAGKRVIPVVGDQMTTARIYAAKDLRSRDPNGYERLSWLIVVPGWFHVVMNLGMSTFDSFRGGDKTMSFINDVTLLGRTGLTMNMRKKRPDFHTNDEFLRHKLYALVRSLWMHYASCDSIENLVTWVKSQSPDAVKALATRIYSERISSAAVYDLSREPEPDEVLSNTILQTRDLLQYYSTRTAIQSGNVGWLEDLLPSLVIYFKGRDNYNYAQAMAETMQWMRNEASPEMRDAIRDNVWLVNTSGRKLGFYEADRLQEFNNGKEKQFGPPPQTTSWESHKDISPAIPMLGEIAKHVEDNIFDFQRTKVHKETPMELDVSRLAARHLHSAIHEYHADRKLEDKNDIANDHVQIGMQSLINTNWLANLAANREEYWKLQSKEQVYAEDLAALFSASEAESKAEESLE